ncbi:class I SAM-dependent DNA methyltransferase [Nitrolancea hollandica]|uniref:site-specific DNA-methyltransferase (adenine-specific) n=1 Tax=Nitrolancea hollandica Lb TaxID=1129897 RepID=I4EJQ6_9BACT|nr:DNA methyltransferase [Nitrolancea hollandica]CCF84918.1 conserved hypothetical protein [Nitrolancea hollandica Lb]
MAQGAIHGSSMTPQAFMAKWAAVKLKEKSAAQEHFIDLCRMLGQKTPAEADPEGTWYCFEKGATKSTGSQGFADVWMRKHFAWEYKGKHANLEKAYQQLLLYHEHLENPPLLIVCDLDRYEIHTKFTGTPTQVHSFTNDELGDPAILAKLRAVFTNPTAFRPSRTVEAVTEEAANRFGKLAIGLRERGVDPHRAAHFLVQILFCLFAEDIGLLPKGLFTRLLKFTAAQPAQFPAQIEQLLTAMRDGGSMAFEPIARFNGGLFAEIGVEPLTGEELASLAKAAELDWSNIEPAIFGTLFERSLDPSKRAQLGAHYTGRADIERVVEPVVMAPLRRRWAEVRAEAETRKAAWDAAPNRSEETKRRKAFENTLFAFQEELAKVRVLDPACGSGNFLYVALAALKDLEKEVISYGTASGLPHMFPRVVPGQLSGLEINEYARELAQVVVWIGYLQWMTANGFQVNRDPVLEPLETIRLQDALLDRSDPEHPKDATWPEADFIIGNPPFLGGNRVRHELGDLYLEDLFAVYDGRVPRFADLCCYFFEKARKRIATGQTKRAGLLATNSIRGGANRKVLERIKQTGDIFMAWSDEPWILDGAAVRISIVGFDGGSEPVCTLNGSAVTAINSDLTGAVDIAKARQLRENLGIAFMGPSPKAPFDIDSELAHQMLAEPLNVNGRPNSDVVRPVASAIDLVRRSREKWTIDFALMPLEQAAQYEMPFEYVKQHIYPIRMQNRRDDFRGQWWQYARPRPEMRQALEGMPRFIATPAVAKHRIFVWIAPDVLCNQGTLVFARDDDYFFGVLHSRAHELWSLRMGTSLEDRPRYTPTTCFETFPLPWPPGQEPTDDPRVQAIAEAARTLNEQRERWLNPEGASEAELKKRTLTNLYNARPNWLDLAHKRLDWAVFAAYGWPENIDDEEILARLLALNLERAGGG